MVYLRINMIRTSGKDNPAIPCLVQEFDSFLALPAHIFAAGGELIPGIMDGRPDLTVRKRELFAELFDQTVGDCLLALEGQERVDEIHLAMYDRIHIIFNVLRVGGDDGAVVVVVRLFKFIPLIGNGRIEDVLYAFVDQPLYMPVRQFRRITFGLAGDGLDAQLVYLSCRSRREHYPEAQFREECKPERIVFIHVQHARDTDDTAFCFFLGERLIIKVAVELVVKQVRHGVFGFFLAETALTPVAGDKLTSAAEMVDSQTARIGTAAAFCHGGRVFQIFDILNREHGRALAVGIPFPGDQGGSERAHDTCDIRTDSFAVRDLFKAS